MQFNAGYPGVEYPTHRVTISTGGKPIARCARVPRRGGFESSPHPRTQYPAAADGIAVLTLSAAQPFKVLLRQVHSIPHSAADIAVPHNPCDLHQRNAADAVDKLYANGLFKAHPAKPYYEATQEVGILLHALLELGVLPKRWQHAL